MPKNKSARIAIVVVLLLLLAFGGVYGVRAYANSRKLNALQTQAAELLSQPRESAGTSAAANGGDRRWDGFREIHQQVEALPVAYQQQFRQSMGNLFMQREEQRYDEYLSLDKVERKKYLDKVIAEGEQRRKQWEARRKQMEAEHAQQAASATAGQAGAGAPAPANRGGWGNRSQSARLDRTSPELRAKRAEFRRDMEQRRKERGLPEGRWGRW